MSRFFNSANWSERQQMVAIILGTGILIVVLWYVLLHPQRRDSRQLTREIRGLRDELARGNYHDRSVSLLSREKNETVDRMNELFGAWADMLDRITVFEDPDQLARSQVDRIDFKVKLIAVRNRLHDKANTASITIPTELGLTTMIRDNEDARIRMIQLLTVEKLVDLALDLKIKMVEDIGLMPPIEHRIGAKNEVYMEEYPVVFTFVGDMQNIYALLDATLQDRHVFMFRHLGVEKASMTQVDVLRVRAVVSALLCTQRPEKVKQVSTEKRPFLPTGI